MSPNNSEYNLKDPIVGEALTRFDEAAEKTGVEYALGGGLAVHSYLVEGIAEKLDTDLEDLSSGDVARYLRSTGDLDIPVKSNGNMPELKGALFNSARYVGGELEQQSNGKYFGEMELGDEGESIDLNIFDSSAKGFTEEQFEEQFRNSNRYDDGNISFKRVGLENIVWMKADSRREKDIADLAYLMHLRGEDVDDDYMHEIIDDEDTARVYEQAKDEEWRDEVLEKLAG